MGLLRRDRPGHDRYLVRPRDAQMLAIARRDLGGSRVRCWRWPAPGTRSWPAAHTASPGCRSRSGTRSRSGPMRSRRHLERVNRPSHGSPWASSRARSARCPRRARARITAALLTRLGLGVPAPAGPQRGTPWRVHNLLALVAGTFEKIGNEIYNLQRPEIGEVPEAPRRHRREHHDAPETQPGKRGAPGRPRAASCAPAPGWGSEGMVGEHERDGAAWKTEWAFLPQASGRGRRRRWRFAAELVAGLGMNARRMRANVDAPARLRAGRARDARARRSTSAVTTRTTSSIAPRWPARKPGLTFAEGPARRSRRSPPRCRPSTRCWEPERALGATAELDRRGARTRGKP